MPSEPVPGAMNTDEQYYTAGSGAAAADSGPTPQLAGLVNFDQLAAQQPKPQRAGDNTTQSLLEYLDSNAMGESVDDVDDPAAATSSGQLDSPGSAGAVGQ